MSADFWIIPFAGDKCDKCGRSDPVENSESFNITYNLTPMFCEVSGGEGLGDWFESRSDGKVSFNSISTDAYRILQGLKERPELSEMNPPNGWGSYSQLVETWGKFVDGLAAAPEAKIGCLV